MKVSCPSCQTNYNIDDKRIPPGGAKLKCARCQNTFPIKPDESASAPAPAAIPLPACPAAGGVVRPGVSFFAAWKMPLITFAPPRERGRSRPMAPAEGNP